MTVEVHALISLKGSLSLTNIYRLYCKGVFLSHRRGRRNIHPQQSLVKIEGVLSRRETDFYMGKRVAYVYKVHKRGKGMCVCINGSHEFLCWYFDSVTVFNASVMYL